MGELGGQENCVKGCIHHTCHICTTHKWQKSGVAIMHIWSAGRGSCPCLTCM
jgi:hypothetical protein